MYTEVLNSIRNQVTQAKARLDNETALYDDSFCSDLEVLQAMNSAIRALDEATRQLNRVTIQEELSTVR